MRLDREDRAALGRLGGYLLAGCGVAVLLVTALCLLAITAGLMVHLYLWAV